MNVFEKMVLEEQDSDNKFVDAASFFVSMKTPMAKTAQKGITKVKATKLPDKLENTTAVREAARNKIRDAVKSAVGKSVSLQPRISGKAKLKIQNPSASMKVEGAELAKVKRIKKPGLDKEAQIIGALPAILAQYAKKAPGQLKNLASSPKVEGFLAGFRPAGKKPTLFQEYISGPLSRTTVGRLFPVIGTDVRALRAINKERQARGLSKFTLRDMDQARSWNRGFQRTKNIGAMLSGLGSALTGPQGRAALIGAVSRMGIDPAQLGAAAVGAAGKGQSLMSKRKSMLNSSLLLPAAGALGAGTLGYMGYKSLTSPKQQNPQNPYTMG